MTQSSYVDTADRARIQPRPLLGRWQIAELLHDGNWTQVYRARPWGCPAKWPSDYVVKVVKPEYRDDPIALDLLRRESQVGQSVTHPHLVSILSARLEEPPYLVVMPYLPGKSLDKTISRGRPACLPFALWVVRQVAEALDALHAQNWMHGDVKPSNLIVAPQGHATLIDLGFAQELNRDQRITRPQLMATPYYTAPERLTGAGCCGSSDIYSLGIVLYEMLTGRRPFEASEPIALAVAHLQEKAPEPRRFTPDLHPRVVRLVRRMLAKDPLRRPAASELVAVLVELEVETFDEWAA